MGCAAWRALRPWKLTVLSTLPPPRRDGHRHRQDCGQERDGGGPAAPAASVHPQVDCGDGTGQVAYRPEPAGDHGRHGREEERRHRRRPPPALGVPERCQDPESGPERLAGRVPARRRRHERGRAHARPSPPDPGRIRPVSRATSRPARSITATRMRVGGLGQHLGQFLQRARPGDQRPREQPPGRHDVRVVRHKQVRDRPRECSRCRHIGEVVAVEPVNRCWFPGNVGVAGEGNRIEEKQPRSAGNQCDQDRQTDAAEWSTETRQGRADQAAGGQGHDQAFTATVRSAP